MVHIHLSTAGEHKVTNYLSKAKRLPPLLARLVRNPRGSPVIQRELVQIKYSVCETLHVRCLSLAIFPLDLSKVIAIASFVKYRYICCVSVQEDIMTTPKESLKQLEK